MKSLYEINRQIAELQKQKTEIESGRGKAIDELVGVISKLRQLGVTDNDIITIGSLKPMEVPSGILSTLSFEPTKTEKIFIPYRPKAPVKKPRKGTPRIPPALTELHVLSESMRERDKSINELAAEGKHGTYHHLWWMLNNGAMKKRVRKNKDGTYHLCKYGSGKGLNMEAIHTRKAATDNKILSLLDKPMAAYELYPLVSELSSDSLRGRISDLIKDGRLKAIPGDFHKTKYVRADVMDERNEQWKKHTEQNKVQPPAQGEDGKTWRKNQIKRILSNGNVWASNTMIDTLADSALGFSIAKKAVQYKVAQLTSDFYFRQRKNVSEARMPSVLEERFNGQENAFKEIESFVFSSKDKGEITVTEWAQFLYLGEEKALLTWDWLVFYAAKILQIQDLGTSIQIIKDRLIWKPLVHKEFEEVRA